LCGLALGAPVGAGAVIEEARLLDSSGWDADVVEAIAIDAQGCKVPKRKYGVIIEV